MLVVGLPAPHFLTPAHNRRKELERHFEQLILGSQVWHLDKVRNNDPGNSNLTRHAGALEGARALCVREPRPPSKRCMSVLNHLNNLKFCTVRVPKERVSWQ